VIFKHDMGLSQKPWDVIARSPSSGGVNPDFIGVNSVTIYDLMRKRSDEK
jgi:hypothetical protein